MVCLLATYLGVLPKGMAGCFLFMMVLGEILGWIGDHTPIIKDFLGGAVILLLASLMLSLLAQFLTVAQPEVVEEAVETGRVLLMTMTGMG